MDHRMRRRSESHIPIQPDLSSNVVQIENITANYYEGEAHLLGRAVLQNVSFAIPQGQFVGVRGQSASGKSTILRIMENILKPKSDELTYSGKVYICGQDINTMTAHRRDDMYRRNVGIGFQKTELDLDRAVGANIVSILQSLGQPLDKKYIVDLASTFGICDVLHKEARTLSGGQIARAGLLSVLASRPKVAFLDEPTGALATEGREEVMGMLRTIVDSGTSIVMVSHDDAGRHYWDRELTLADGVLVQDAMLRGQQTPLISA
ncbi:ATP-binding cassette domain-containing protein [Candidatus Saccharibacteria bacterium]|nr:ATP-binding cassette domain-containing protein [Candidatus Saccharibacteria bacterium]